MGIQSSIDQMYSQLGTLDYLIKKSSAKNTTKKEIQKNLDEMALIVEEMKKELKFG